MKITKEQLKDIGIRTLKTAVVVLLAAFVTAWVSAGMTNIEAAAISAATAAGTAILNVFVKLVTNLLDDFNLTEEEIAEAFGGDINE